MFPCTSSKVHGFLNRDWWISIRFVCFLFQDSLLWDRPVSDNNRRVKFSSQIFLIFLILVTCKNKATSACFLRQKNPLTIAISFAILEQSRVILSQAGRARYIVICINPAFTKMIDETEKPTFAIRAARYNEFRCKPRARRKRLEKESSIVFLAAFSLLHERQTKTTAKNLACYAHWLSVTLISRAGIRSNRRCRTARILQRDGFCKDVCLIV